MAISYHHPVASPLGCHSQVVKAAEAQADAAQLQGEGIARQRRAIIDGLRLGNAVRPCWSRVVGFSMDEVLIP